MAFDDLGDGSIWDNEDLVQESDVFRIISAAKTSRQGLSLMELCTADDLIQEVKSLNGDLIQFLSKPSTAAELVELLVNPADPSTEDRAFRAPYMAAELLACEARPVMRAIISSKCKDRPSLSGLQRLLLFADRPGQLRAYLAGYAVRAVEAIARTEPAATVQAVVSTPGVVAACTAHADEPACGRLLAALWRLPYTAADPLFRCGKLHAADPVTLAEALAAMLHPLAVEQPREQRAEPGSAPGSASGGAFPRLPLLVAPSDAPSDPTGLSPVPSLAAARDYAGDNALIVVQEVAAGARVGPGAGVFVLRDVTRGSGGVAGGEEAAAAAAASPEGASGVARARAAASAAGGGEGARLGAAKAVHSRVDTGAVVSLLDAVEAFPWHSLLHASVADALSEVMSRGPHSLADHILRGADLPARFARMLRLTAWPHRLDLVGRPRPPGCATAAYPGLVMRVANAVEAAAARTTSCVGVKASVGGTSTGITLSADLLAWLESNEEWIFVSSGPLSVFNVLSGEYVAGVPPSANNLSSIDREGGAGGGGLLGRLASIDEMPSKFPDAN